MEYPIQIGYPHACQSMIFMRVEWVNFQNPRRTFTSKHSLLPGQEYPGLGILQKFTGIFDEFVGSKQKDGILGIPEHYHTGVYYSKVFLFIDPVLEGRFRAMRRDLKGLTIADVSKAVDQGRLFNITLMKVLKNGNLGSCYFPNPNY